MADEMVLSVSDYSAISRLRDGRSVVIRAVKPDDRIDVLAAVDRTSEQSLYRRFFGIKRGFTEREIDYYINVDFVSHVALVAVLDDGGRSLVLGGARYVLVNPGQAELAFTVDDRYQGQGIGTALLHHLVVIARERNLEQFIADVLPENHAMLKLIEKSGLRVSVKHEPGVNHVLLQL